ncbi:helix-turn-helix domain-containing protein [Paenibacillus tritici]|uniref:helix-turn-helix domain-containing protein n=1 Tax=Paenibacillus tritici TaxID=1873425 RepID=UPI001BAD361B|nr:helix-turn-helix domain-containing protein [Paenibacillus tritici]QUL57681.1 helix-turn-helix domain-containing protein [Paenibacillus tritici]
MNDQDGVLPGGTFGQLNQMWFRLRSIEQNNSLTGECSLRLQFLESHLLLIPVSGRGWITVDGKYGELRAGAAFVCLPGQLIEASLEGSGEQSVYILRFDVFAQRHLPEQPDQLSSTQSRLPFPLEGEAAVASTVTYSKHCEAITASMGSTDPLQQLLAQSRFYELLYSLLSDTRQSEPDDTDTIMERVKLYIEQHYREELSITLLAGEAGISVRHFIRLFKQKYGLSAIEYLTECRIRQARNLMLPHTNYELKDIAAYVGYKDLAYFRRKFKQVTGVAPAAFMRNTKLKIVAYHGSLIGTLLTLNVIPCAAPADHPWTEYYRRKYGTGTVLPLLQEDNDRLQQLVSLRPDYILGLEQALSPAMQQQLQELAPAPLLPRLQMDWRAQLEFIGHSLGKSQEAAAWLAAYERKAETVRASLDHPLAKGRLLIARLSAQTLTVLSNRSLGEVFYDDLQFIPAPLVNRKLSRQTLTLAELKSADTDKLLLIVDEDTESQAIWSEIQHLESLKRPDPAGYSRVELLPPYPWTEYTSFTQEMILDLAPLLWRNRT